eukprot:563932-Pleurochrysis_carterae.AAC.2
MTSACRSPPSSPQSRTITEVQPFSAPSSRQRTVSASQSDLLSPKKMLPAAIELNESRSTRRRPKRSAATPHSAAVGIRPMIKNVGSSPATKPARSASSAHPRSTER